MGSFYGISMPDDQWRSMSAEDRLKYLSNHGGPTGNFVDAMQRSRDEHPNWNSPNYFDAVLGALARGGGRIPMAHAPGAKSGLGMMSGDAGEDIANATQQTTQNYGSDPRGDALTGQLQAAVNAGHVPGASQEARDAAAAIEGKQQQRVNEWMGHMGESLGQITGTTDAYVPGAGEEWAAIQGYDPLTGQVRWTPRRRR